MKNRRYEYVPLDKIEVLNYRNRDEGQFSENVRSIEAVGLLKPVVLNERHLQETGKYQLVCGEGRLIAHQRLEEREIAAEIIEDLQAALEQFKQIADELSKSEDD